MARDMLTDEELQKSAALSQDDSGYQNRAITVGMSGDRSAMNNTGAPIVVKSEVDDGKPTSDADTPMSDIDAMDLDTEDGGKDEKDAQTGEPMDTGPIDEDGNGEDEESEEDGDEDFDQDAEGVPDDDIASGDTAQVSRDNAAQSAQSSDADEDDEDEGVGAVKIKPGETDEEEDSESDGFSQPAAEDSEDDAAWEEEPEANDDEADEESDSPVASTCIFCKKGAEGELSDDSGLFVTCTVCEENAHKQCAKAAKSLRGNNTGKWKCPECADDEADDEAEEDEDGEEDGEEVDGTEASKSTEDPPVESTPANGSSTSRHSSRETRLSHKALRSVVSGADSDSVDGQRTLRKRKTASTDTDEHVMSLRKRHHHSSDEQKLSQDETVDGLAGESVRSTRRLRLKVMKNTQVTVENKTPTSLVVKIRTKPATLRDVLLRPSRRRANRGSASQPRGNRGRASIPDPATLTAPFISSGYSQPFYSFFDKETDEAKGKPYGGILNENEADTTKTMPGNEDRRRFEDARQKAEDEWRAGILAMEADAYSTNKKARKSAAPASQIECVEFGGWEIDTWYAAPYPEEYSRNRVLYICEFCLKYMNSNLVAWRHKLKCPAKHPPGDEIYRHESVSVFEVDGRKNPVYCQNLCLLAKLFLGSKTLYYDVEPFLFYVLCEYDDLGYHFVGYFSKEKRASSQNNVSCILTLPIHQRKGYGNLLIDFSYLLTRVEQKTGSPEKPLSDMGLVSYRNYWRLVLCRYLLETVSGASEGELRGLSIRQISDDTGLTADDVVSALEGLRCLVRDPQTGLYGFRVDFDYCREYVAKWESKKYVRLEPKALTWTPYVMGRNNSTNFELGPALTAIAHREEDDDRKMAEAVVGSATAVTNGDDQSLNPFADPGTGTIVTPPQDSVVLESTEANDGRGLLVSDTIAASNGSSDISDDKKAISGIETTNHDTSASDDGSANDPVWSLPYKHVPPSRFEVSPPPAGRRADRSRGFAGRILASRPSSGASRPPRRSIGSTRRTPASRPSGSRRKAGGTGRGPGRWPKGTKKSDYGNADSGPGLPPGWLEQHRLLTTGVEKSESKEPIADEAKDEVQVRVQTLQAGEAKASVISQDEVVVGSTYTNGVARSG